MDKENKKLFSKNDVRLLLETLENKSHSKQVENMDFQNRMILLHINMY